MEPGGITARICPLPSTMFTLSPATSGTSPADSDSGNVQVRGAAGERRTMVSLSPDDVAVSSRSRSSEYVNPDGTTTARFFEDVEFVPGHDGTLQPIDAKLSVRPSDGMLAPAAAGPVAFAPVARDGQQLARLALSGGATVGFSVAGSTAVEAQVDGDTARYVGIRDNARSSHPCRQRQRTVPAIPATPRNPRASSIRPRSL